MFAALIGAGPDTTARAVVGEKGCDSQANRGMARRRGVAPVILQRPKRKTVPARFAEALYRGRARIEHRIGRLRRIKRVAQRCDETVWTFRPIIALVATVMLGSRIHTAWVRAH